MRVSQIDNQDSRSVNELLTIPLSILRIPPELSPSKLRLSASPLTPVNYHHDCYTYILDQFQKDEKSASSLLDQGLKQY